MCFHSMHYVDSFSFMDHGTKYKPFRECATLNCSNNFFFKTIAPIFILYGRKKKKKVLFYGQFELMEREWK